MMLLRTDWTAIWISLRRSAGVREVIYSVVYLVLIVPEPSSASSVDSISSLGNDSVSGRKPSSVTSVGKFDFEVEIELVVLAMLE